MTTPRRFGLFLLLICAGVSAVPASGQPYWIQKAPASSPSARHNHAMAYDAAHGQVVLFGGLNGSGYLSDTWVWDGADWTQKTPQTSPPARRFHAMAYDAARGQVVLFGGSDTWVWDGTNWTQKTPATHPTSREGDAMAYDAARGQVVLFGGADTWVWDGTNWTQKTPATHPTTREGHAMAYDAARGQVVLFGGSATWVWDGTNWAQQVPATQPAARDFHAMADDAAHGQMILSGGTGAPGRLSDTWIWDGTNWTQQISATSPEARNGRAMAYDAAHGQVVLFGGQDINGKVLSDTWVFTHGILATNDQPQSTPVGSAFSFPLEVTVIDSTGAYVSGAQVTFAGPPGMVSFSSMTAPLTGADGRTHVTATATGTPGSYLVTASLSGGDFAEFTLSNVNTSDPDTLTANGTAVAHTVDVAAARAPRATVIRAAPGALPDLTAVKTDNVGGATTLGNSWTWKIHIANVGTGAAGNFANGATILTDYLPSTNIGYGSANTANPVGITGTISCAIASNLLTCTASGAVSIAAGGSLDVSFLATPTAIGTFVNPPALDTTADVVYGQGGNLTTNGGGISANGLANPIGAASDSSGNLYVADYINSRVLYYPAGSTTATRVYGQGGSFTTATANNGGISANSLYFPYAVALDSSGNLYVADSSNNRVLYYPAGSTTATRVYGQGGSFTSGTGNNGGITANSLNAPEGVALDSSGNLYVVDTGNSRVLYYPAGSTTATRVCGQGGSFTTNTQNNGGISANSLFLPVGVALDSGGNLYVADQYNDRVLYYSAGSTTATRVYGQGGSFTTGDPNTGGVSANSLFAPFGVALDSSGNLYVGDQNNNRVLYYPAGSTTATRVYGQGGSFTTGTANNGGVSANSLSVPSGVAFDSGGNLYVADDFNNRVLKYNGSSCLVDPLNVVVENSEGNNSCSDTVTVTAAPDLTAVKTDNVGGATTLGTPWTWKIHVANVGAAAANFLTGATILMDNLPSTNIGYGSAGTANPSGITGTISCGIASSTLTCTASGAVSIAVGGSIDVSFLATPTAIGTFLNPPIPSSTAAAVYGQGGSFTTNTANLGGISADSLNSPSYGAVLDSGGNLYVADGTNHRVLYYPAGSTTATRVYGQGGSFTTNTANNGGISANSLFSPQGVALDSSGNLYVADAGNSRVLYYPAGSTTATRVYGQGIFSTNTANNGGISRNSLWTPRDVTLDSSGNLYVADAGNSRVLYYPAGSTTAAGVYGQGGSFTTGDPNTGGISANSLNSPAGVRLDSSGNLYAADSNNGRVLYYPAGSTTATRVYGQGGSFTSNNGGIGANGLDSPFGVVLDSSGNLYVADRSNNRVLYYPAGSTTATRVYGQGGSFTSNNGNNGGISANSLFFPRGLALDSSGNLYVGDTNNNRVLKYNGSSCVVDPGNVMVESNESNNSCSDTVTVSAPVATMLNKTAGDNQSAAAGTAYATNLKVTVLDQNGMPFQGAPVTFAAVAGGTGASGTFAGTPTQPITTLADGTATAPVLTANGTSGAFTVTATTGALTATFNLLNIATTPPTADSVTPNTGSGTSQNFTFKYSSVNGFGYLNDVYALFKNSINGVNACFALYDKTANGFYLYNDAGSGLTGPLAPGAGSTLSNSQCTLSGTGSSVSGSGNTLTVVMNLTFNVSFAGAQNIFMYAADNGGMASGWQNRGTWTVPAANTPPTADSVTPNTGSGSSQNFTFKYSSVNGFGYLNDVYALFRNSVNGVNACFAFYDKGTGGFYLYNDAGSGLTGPLAPGAGTSLSNSQCTLSGTGSSVSGSGNTLTVVMNLTFNASFGGTQNIFMYAADNGGMASGWQNRGNWTVPAGSTPPTADSVNPASGSGLTQAFTFKYSSANGSGYLNDVYALFRNSINGVNACFAFYDKAANGFYLYNDAGSGLTGPLAPGAGTSLSNSQCTLSGTGSSVSGSGNTLTVVMNLTFNSSFNGTQNIFMYAADNGGMASGWQNGGNWTVPAGNTPPTADSVNPATGGALTQAFTFKYSSANGFGYLTDVYALFRNSINGVNACFALYDRAANGFYLYNDAGTALMGPLAPGAGTSLSNSQCTLSGTGSSVSGSGNTLTVVMNLTFNVSFAGTQNIFMYAADNGSMASGWQNRGTWTVP